MEIKIELKEPEFNTEIISLLKEDLELEKENEIQPAIAKLTKSAVLEYFHMFSQQGMPNRADETKQDRLYYLIKYYYQDHIPEESEVKSIFQLTNSQSKTLLRNTISRYRSKIERQIRATARYFLQSSNLNKQTEKWEASIPSEVLVEDINLSIKHKEPYFSTLKKKPDTASVYEIAKDTYDLLKNEFGF